MVLLAVTVPNWAAALETHLIQVFCTVQGCQNEAPGGESLPSVPPVFVYFVFADLEDMVRHRLAASRAEYERLQRNAFRHLE